MNVRSAKRLAVLLAAAAPLFASCSVDDQTIGPPPSAPAGGTLFTQYVALGTSIGAGIQSGGINDSTQREAYPYQLAVQMGLTPQVNWFYPSFAGNGCPAPLSNALTGARVGGAPAAACGTRSSTSFRPWENNLSIPSIRASQILHITNLQFPNTDTLKLAQFIVGSQDPIVAATKIGPTFVTLEVGANDVLGAATRGDTTLLTPAAAFSATLDTIAAKLDSSGAKVAISNVPNVASIPHFAIASVAWCLKTGACGPTLPATAPFNAPTWTIDNSCAPAAAGGIGDTYRIPFSSLGAMMGTIAAGGTAVLNCGTDVATTTAKPTTAVPNPPAVPVPTLTAAEVTAINNRVTAFNTAISALATAHGYALVDFAALLAAQAASIPPFPSLSTPTNLFGPLFSQDGIHPNKAGQKIIANGFIAAINTKFSTTLAPIP